MELPKGWTMEFLGQNIGWALYDRDELLWQVMDCSKEEAIEKVVEEQDIRDS